MGGDGGKMKMFEGDDGFVGLTSLITGKIGSSVRKSMMGLFSKSQVSLSMQSSPVKSNSLRPLIRWKKGEIIGSGAFGRVYMGMNMDSGELLAIKQVSVGANVAYKERTQAHIQDLEEEVKLLKNLSHPNIVRYLGTAREEGTLNILLEFVPGGSISSLLGKFGSFSEDVTRRYTKQLLQGLEYLHQNGIMHRDIKGANILVDNKGCIKLADFGASKQVVELATLSGAKSMKGTPYWMAPEVILQTGHTFSADIWSVGCTVIEMATGKPPWSQQFQEVAALLHIGSTKSHPPIPDHLSVEAKDFLLKCLQKEPNLRPTASELLQHPFVNGDQQYSGLVSHRSALEPPSSIKEACAQQAISMKPSQFEPFACGSSSNDMCRIDNFAEIRNSFATIVDPFEKSFNPISEPMNMLSSKLDDEQQHDFERSINVSDKAGKSENYSSFTCNPVNEDEDEVTESKIGAFLAEKALEMKKLQSPLYEEFLNTLNSSSFNPGPEKPAIEDHTGSSAFCPKSKKSPMRVIPCGVSPKSVDDNDQYFNRHSSFKGARVNHQILNEIPLFRVNEWAEGQKSPSLNFSERQRKWKEELDEELARRREMKRLAGVLGQESPNDRVLNKRYHQRR